MGFFCFYLNFFFFLLASVGKSHGSLHHGILLLQQTINNKKKNQQVQPSVPTKSPSQSVPPDLQMIKTTVEKKRRAASVRGETEETGEPSGIQDIKAEDGWRAIHDAGKR